MTSVTRTSTTRMPSLYIPHGGGPCFFMDWSPRDTWTRMGDFLRGLLASLPARPTAIIVVSAHWMTDDFAVTGGTAPGLLFDYYGFPPHTYELRYPAPGAPDLAARARALLTGAGFATATDNDRGFDHGVFIPLLLMAPAADIPVIQLSVRNDLDPAAHLAAGAALAALRDEGVLILGSGMSFHNMRGYGDPRFGPISDSFDGWLTGAVESDPATRNRALTQWDTAPSARLCHPPRAEEHLIPLMVAAGAGGGDAGTRIFSDRVMETTVSAFRFG
ncbi:MULTISPECIES: DODA-type extradiol aromatic ring-opening family dioxygenase [Tistrella]|uniref:DODA-type extradiol aromatic ring-opening family dioxygenase n=1 Tax=Tistrella TaxID=171436 RepID=UPI0031F6B039